MGSKRPTDLTAVVAITCIAMILALLDVSVPILRAVAGVLFALGITGYAALAAVFPHPTIRLTERILGSVALSMAFATLGGFVLNWTPWGLRPQTWALLLGAITLIAVVCAHRRRCIPLEIAAASTVPIRVTPIQGVLFGFAALVVVVAAGVAYLGAARAPTPGFTQLWLLPLDGGQVRAGFRDEEHQRVSYTLRIRVDGALIDEWTNVTLNPDETWEMQFPAPARQGTTQRIEASLYRANQDDVVYRHVMLER